MTTDREVVSWDFVYFKPTELSCKCDKCTPYGELGVSFKLVETFLTIGFSFLKIL